MTSGNGGDVGAVYALLTVLVDEGRAFRHDMKAEMISVRADIGGLREAVTAYHATVLGHGILISELEERVRRIEHHLALPPLL